MAIGHVAEGLTMPWTNGTGADIDSGDVVAFAAMIGVALGAIPDGSTGELAVAEVWILPKNEALAITQGDKLYWDVGDGNINKTAQGNIPCGIAYTHELAATPTVQVSLNA